ncbi:MAG: DNA polymerase III subunit beta [Actinomycetota bacterium]
MQIEGEKQTLVEIGQSVLRVVSPRATLPVLGGIRITAGESGVEFAASDLEMFITSTYDLAVSEQGAVVAPGRLFSEILRSLPGGKVSINGQDGQVRIEAGRSEFSMRGFPVADFPQAPEVPGGEAFKVPGLDLGKALSRVVRAASTDESRPVLTGVLWILEAGMLKLVATDSYRLAIADVVVKEAPPDKQAIVPGRALTELSRHIANAGDADVEVWLGDNQAVFKVGHTQLVTRLIEGEFPNWRNLIPDNYENRLLVNRDHFAGAVGRVGLVAQANTPIKFHLEDEIQLTASESGVAEATEVLEEGKYEGSPMVVAFNPKFFSDGLEGVDTEQALLEVIDPAKPALLKAEDDPSYTYLLMPVRLP